MTSDKATARPDYLAKKATVVAKPQVREHTPEWAKGSAAPTPSVSALCAKGLGAQAHVRAIMEAARAAYRASWEALGYLPVGGGYYEDAWAVLVHPAYAEVCRKHTSYAGFNHTAIEQEVGHPLPEGAIIEYL
jgi:hypothetical protein